MEISPTSVGGQPQQASVVKGAGALLGNGNLVFEAEGIRVPHFHYINALAALPAGIVAGGDDDFALIVAENELAGEAGADYPEIVAIFAVDHMQFAVRYMVKGNVGNVDSVLGADGGTVPTVSLGRSDQDGMLRTSRQAAMKPRLTFMTFSSGSLIQKGSEPI